MSLHANVIESGSRQTQGHFMWVVLGAVVAAQLSAFWLLCSHQVRRAEARHNEAVVQQMALSDCLQYIPGSTIASCSSRMDPKAMAQDQPGSASVAGVVPASFSYR